MAEKRTTQTVRAADGTDFVFESWLQDGQRVTMAPGWSQFDASCPHHGPIAGSYEALTVGYAIDDHAVEWHGGLERAADLLGLVPAIQL